MSGSEIHDRLRSDPQLASIPVILVTIVPLHERAPLTDVEVIRRLIDIDELLLVIRRATGPEELRSAP